MRRLQIILGISSTGGKVNIRHHNRHSKREKKEGFRVIRVHTQTKAGLWKDRYTTHSKRSVAVGNVSSRVLELSKQNPRTRKGHRFGLNKFVEWFCKTAEEALAMRQEDLTQKPAQHEFFRNRKAHFSIMKARAMVLFAKFAF